MRVRYRLLSDESTIQLINGMLIDIKNLVTDCPKCDRQLQNVGQVRDNADVIGLFESINANIDETKVFKYCPFCGIKLEYVADNFMHYKEYGNEITLKV